MKIRDNILVRVDNEDIVDGKFVVPKFVSEIGKNCFSNCNTILEELIMHDGVETIGEYAFHSCVALKKVKFSTNLKSIFQYAFSNCHSIRSVDLPDSIEILADGAFDNCINLEKIKLPKDITVIESYLFNQCVKLKQVSVPNKVYKIENSAFASCISLEKVDLPNSMRIINKYAFAQCTGLKKIDLKNGVFRLGDYAFYSCFELEDCKLPDTLLSIGNHTFESCMKIKEFDLKEHVESIGEGAFANCSFLSKINIPSKVQTIEDSQFSGCLGLFEIDIPNSIKSIKDNAFNDAYLLELVLPDSISSIGNFAFANNRMLSNVILSKNLESLGELAFDNCPNIERLVIFEGFKAIAHNAIGTNNDIKYIIKDENKFILAKNLEASNCEYVKLDNKSKEIKELLIKFWDKKDKILKDIKNDKTFYIYKTLYSFLWQEGEKFEEFLDKHNLTFYNTIDFQGLDDANKNQFLKFYFNLGGFLPQNLFRNKTADGIMKEKMLNYSQIVTEFLKEQIVKNKFDLKKSRKLFFEMDVNGFNQDFTIFFLENFDILMLEEKANSGFIIKCYNHFDEVQSTHTTNKGEQRQLKATVDKFKDYFNENKFTGIVDEHTRLIAKMLSPYHSKQIDFDNAVSIDAERINNDIPNSILSFHLKELDDGTDDLNIKSIEQNIDKENLLIKFISASVYQKELTKGEVEFSYDWLDRDNPINFIISKVLQQGCAHLNGVGYGIMRASIMNNDVQNMAIRARVKLENGKFVDLGYIAKATFYINRNERYGIFNTIKVRDIELNKALREKLFDAFIRGMKDFVSYYNKENPTNTLKEITIGKSSNDLVEMFQQHCRKRIGDDILIPLDFGKFGNENLNYFGDSVEEQFILYDENNLIRP